MSYRLAILARATTIAALALALGLGAAHAQTPGLTAQTLAQGTAAYDPVIGGPADVAVVSITLAPGSGTGWHRHAGRVWGVITRGTLTITEHDGCHLTYPAGAVRVEIPNDVHEGRNEGAEPLEMIVTYVIAAGQPLAIEVPAPTATTCAAKSG